MGTILPGLQSCNPENNLLLASSGSPPRSGALGPVGPGSGSPIPAEGHHPGCWGLARSASRGPLREGQGRVGPRPAHHPPQPLQPRPLQCFPNSLPGLGAFKTKAKRPCLPLRGACRECACIPSRPPAHTWTHLGTLGQQGRPNLSPTDGETLWEGRQKESDVEPDVGARPWGGCGRKPGTPARVGTAPKIRPPPGPCHREGQSREPQGPPWARAAPSE